MNFKATKQPIPEPIIPAALSRGAPSLRAKYPITAPIRHNNYNNCPHIRDILKEFDCNLLSLYRTLPPA